MLFSTRNHARKYIPEEDQDSVRNLICHTLRAAGYDVIDARDGTQAMAAARGAKIDMLITDVMLPGMSGVKLAERLLPEHPELRVLFVSG